ncbi:hypothetical protein [Paenibacillus sp. Marseille-Q4541]|uniref:hypothetical protein n=1 Tax=Paenibacillus sp. Marseille-Q4541 TaxID=2831522 RepID=UPI001BA58F43|nr:hypothetical protein [Paenibacillus sp. Marseille-Q4541]
MNNKFLDEKVVELAAKFMFQAYGAISASTAFDMAVGEAEVEFDTDIDAKFNDSYKKRIETLYNKLNS